MPQLRPRGASHPEQSLAANLAAVLAAVQAYWSKSGGTVTLVQEGAPVPIDGFNCIAQHSDCAGDNHDAAYNAVGFKPNEPYYLRSNSTGELRYFPGTSSVPVI